MNMIFLVKGLLIISQFKLTNNLALYKVVTVYYLYVAPRLFAVD